MVARGIASFLRRKECAPLLAALAGEVSQAGQDSQSGEEVAYALVGQELLEAVSAVHRAVRGILQALPQNAVRSPSSPWEQGLGIIAWLVILAVDEQWLTEQTKVGAGTIAVQVPLTTPLGAEIVTASLDTAAAAIDIQVEGMQLQSTFAVPLDRLPERGWDAGATVGIVTQWLCKALYYIAADPKPRSIGR
ncbi:MAG: hypothetical protein AB1634_18440 [Thermodesulfobacteriota bacterium]